MCHFSAPIVLVVVDVFFVSVRNLSGGGSGKGVSKNTTWAAAEAQTGALQNVKLLSNVSESFRDLYIVSSGFCHLKKHARWNRYRKND